MASRKTRSDWFLDLAELVAERGTCPRASVGALIIQGGRIVSMGYNGSPPGLPHCTEVGCEQEVLKSVAFIGTNEKLHGDVAVEGCVRTVHAEANAIAFAARQGVATEGAQLYCTHGPCYGCAKLIISAGIWKVTFATPYRDTRGEELLRQAKVGVNRYLDRMVVSDAVA